MATWRGSVNTLAELQSLDTTFLDDNLPVLVRDEQSWYIWNPSSTTTISSPEIVGRSDGIQSTSLNTDLLAYWQLEETGQPFSDETANNLDLSEEINTTVTSVTGVLNNGIELNAAVTNSGLTRTDALLNIFNGTGLVTFNTWIRIASGTNMDLALIYYAGDYELWYTGGAAPGSSFFRAITGGVDTVDFNFDISTTPIFSNYVMLTSIWNSNTGTTTVLINLEIVAIIQNTTIPTGSNIAEFFTESSQGDVEIDELAIWTRQLSTKELNLLYNKGNAYGINAADLVGRWSKSGGTDELVKVSSNDSTPDFLGAKLLAGNFVTINELNDGLNEVIEISSTPASGPLINTLQTFTNTTANIANLAFDNITINGEKAFTIGAIESSVPATVRLYSSLASRTADAGRPLGTPSTSATEGLVAEVQLTLGNLRFDLSNPVTHTNLENPAQPEIYAQVFNESGGLSTVTINLYAYSLAGSDETVASSTPSRLLLEATNSIPIVHSSAPNLQDLVLDTANLDLVNGYNAGTGEYTFANSTLALVSVQLQLNGTAVAAEKFVSLQLDTGNGYNTVAFGNHYSDGVNDINNTWRAQKLINVSSGYMIKAQFFTTAASTFTNNIAGSFLQIAELRTGFNVNVIESSSGTTASIANLAFDNITIPTSGAVLIGAIESDVPATVRLYSSLASRTADSGRPLGTPPPLTIEGLVSEVQLTLGNLRIDLSDAAAHVNLENPQLPEIYAQIFNESGGVSTVTITLYNNTIGGVSIAPPPGTYVGSTSALANLAGENIEINAVNTLGIVAVETDVPATVRLYHNNALRTADAGRPLGTPPPVNIQGLLTEVQTTVVDLRTDLNGATLFINTESPQDGLIYARVFNESGGVSSVNVTIHGSIL